MYVECKTKDKQTKKINQSKNTSIKCVGQQNGEIKPKKKKGSSVIMFSSVEYVPPSWVPKQFFCKKEDISPTVLPVASRQQERQLLWKAFCVVLLCNRLLAVRGAADTRVVAAAVVGGWLGGGAVEGHRHFMRQTHMVGSGPHTLWTLKGSVPSRKTSWWSSKGREGGLLFPAELKGWDAVLWVLDSSLPLGITGTLELKFR